MSARPEPPMPPPEPDPAECCGEGCVRCVFDVHEAELERYRAELEQWRQRWGNQDDPEPAGEQDLRS